MSNEKGINAPIQLSTQFLFFIDYKIHEYSPQELYENKARLFESLMTEWNNMSDKEKEKYRLKVKFTNGGEMAKYRKEESALETLYETAFEKQEQVSQHIIQEKSQKQDSSENLSSQQIKDRKVSTQVRSFEEQKYEFQSSLELISDKETQTLQYPIKSQSSLIKEVLRNEENDENERNDNIKEENETNEYIQQENQVGEKINNRQKKKQDQKTKKLSIKRTSEQKKPKGSNQKKALSPTKQIQLQNQENQKYFAIESTLTLKKLKDVIKIYLIQQEG